MLLMDITPQHAHERPSLLQRVYRAFNARFEQLRAGYNIILEAVMERRRAFAGAFLGFCVLSCALVFVLGRDFFPNVDAGQIRMHMRLPSGTRIEETTRVADQVDVAIRKLVPPRELGTMLENLGVPISGISNSYSNAGAFGTFDGEFQISLNPGHRPTLDYIDETAPRTTTTLSRHGVFLSTGRHRDSDLEFRAAGSHRRAVHRRGFARQL